jgi:hypothetical protein
LSPASATLPARRTAPRSGSVEPAGGGPSGPRSGGGALRSRGFGGAVALAVPAALLDAVDRERADFAPAFARAAFARVDGEALALERDAPERDALAEGEALPDGDALAEGEALPERDALAEGEALPDRDALAEAAPPAEGAFAEPLAPPRDAPPRLSLRCPGRDRGRLPRTPCSSLLSAATREK